MKKRPAGAAAAAAPAKRRPVASPAKKVVGKPGGPESRPSFKLTRCHSLVPEEVRELYERVLPLALAVPKAKRHRFEELVVAEACGVLAGVREEIERKMQEAEAAMGSVGDDEAQCVKSIEEQGLVVEGLNEALKSKTKDLAEAAKAYRGCREAVRLAKIAEKEGSEKVEQAKSKKVELEAYMQKFKELKEGTFESPEAETMLKESLPAMLTKFSLTDALVQAAPTALVKEPAARGEFDASVVEHVEEELLARLASYESTIKDAEPAAAALSEKTKDAVEALAEASEAQVKAADDMTEARITLTAAEEKVLALERSRAAMGVSARELKGAHAGLRLQLQKVQEDESTLTTKAEGPKEAAKDPEGAAAAAEEEAGEAQEAAGAPAAAEAESEGV